MDRQRRAAALSARSTRVVLFLVSVAVVATSLPACQNRKELARQKAELTTALDAFKAQIAQLQKEAAPLRARLNALVSAGWTVLHVTATRLRDEFDGIVSEVRATMRRSRRS